MAELRRIAEVYNYRETLDKMLRDQLVQGINDKGIQRKLLLETSPLAFARAVAQGPETAVKLKL